MCGAPAVGEEDVLRAWGELDGGEAVRGADGLGGQHSAQAVAQQAVHAHLVHHWRLRWALHRMDTGNTPQGQALHGREGLERRRSSPARQGKTGEEKVRQGQALHGREKA